MELAKEWSTAESARIWSSTQFGRQAENKPPPGRLLIQNFIARSFALHPSRHLQAHGQNPLLCRVRLRFVHGLFSIPDAGGVSAVMTSWRSIGRCT
jgi:hypothetical protein